MFKVGDKVSWGVFVPQHRNERYVVHRKNYTELHIGHIAAIIDNETIQVIDEKCPNIKEILTLRSSGNFILRGTQDKTNHRRFGVGQALRKIEV